MKEPSIGCYLIVGIVLVVIFNSIPVSQIVEGTNSTEYTSSDQNHIEVGFGGTRVTWVTVICNRTSEIRFMYQDGVWTSTSNTLVASFESTLASYSFEAEHSVYIIEVTSSGPFLVSVTYTYQIEIKTSYFGAFLYSLGIYRV
ncbi:MAG: hypothetical protein EAX87_05465 [Candidatus Thorarchaeota archaeon]|nr:hypothetical protein [Candidatus Thorarchaeota archaeon]